MVLCFLEAARDTSRADAALYILQLDELGASVHRSAVVTIIMIVMYGSSDRKQHEIVSRECLGIARPRSGPELAR
jgi:hypothetical protein